jgi:hypothetical protein
MEFFYELKADRRTLTALLFVLLAAGCTEKPRFEEPDLPLPPSVDSGIYDKHYVRADFGFGFPVPAGWNYVRYSAERETDEVARFDGPLKGDVFLVTAFEPEVPPKSPAKAWEEALEADLGERGYQVLEKGEDRRVALKDGGAWTAIPFQLKDSRGGEWSHGAWFLDHGGLLIGAETFLSKKDAGSAKGKKLLEAVEESLKAVQWYLPIGERGISLERFELRHFNEEFRKALESRSLPKVLESFDEMYPSRAEWKERYEEMTRGKIPIKAELAGLVIDGDYATASYVLIREPEKEGEAPKKHTFSFRLSKKEGNWEVVAPVERKGP